MSNIDFTGNFNPNLAEAIRNKEIARVESLPSPIFPFSNSAILSGAYQIFDFTTENQVYGSFAPFTNLKIVNTSAQPLYIYFGQIGAYYDVVTGNTTNVYERQDMGGGVSSVKIYNAGTSTITAGQVLLSVWKAGATPTSAVQESQSWFSKLFPQKFGRYNSSI